MAHLHQRRPQNINGDFYVDSTCIDCDTCRWMTPEVFSRIAGRSAVYHQPVSEVERLRSLQALLACPTSSIGTIEKPYDIKEAQQSFPIPVAENVYHCGYHAENSYGAASYLIVRPEGNVMVDSPRFTPPLVKQIEKMGGIRYLYLTHKDDVADHQKYREYLECDRILHRDDVTSNTRSVEIQLTGSQPFQLASDLLIIPVPGHTKGHTVLLYNQFLFTGDHLAWSERSNSLVAWRDVCWYSWSEQIKSMRKLTKYAFEWVLPGHGRRHHADADQMQHLLQQCVIEMEAV
jgi:glyoxylase-like metal-dependent hydrolase (beta-lactamase superfamily II)/ferredoxin